MRIIGHRGAAGHAPENTLLSVEKALSLGASWVEVDVRASSDGVPVVIHDETLERTTGVLGRVAESPLDVLRSLDVGGGEKIPLVGEVLEFLRGRAGLNLEIKDAGAVLPLCEALRATLRDGWKIRDLLVSSFDGSALMSMRELLPDIPRGVLSDSAGAESIRLARCLGAGALGIPTPAFGREVGAACHRAGLELFVFTANEPEEILRLAGAGADGIFTDFPDRARDALAHVGMSEYREPDARP